MSSLSSDLTVGKITTLIKSIAIPAVVGTFFQTLYNIVDVKFAGMISPLALTGISKVFPVYFLIIALSAGLSIGSTSIVSIIGLDELTRKANELVVSQYRPLEIYTFLVLEYLVLILVISYLVRKMEKKLSN